MKEFRRIEDVARVNLPEGLSEAVRRMLTTLLNAYAEIGERYDPEVDGHTVLIEESDSDEIIRAAMGGYTLLDAPLEGVVHDEKRQCISGHAWLLVGKSMANETILPYPYFSGISCPRRAGNGKTRKRHFSHRLCEKSL
jgi:hypothetical protein